MTFSILALSMFFSSAADEGCWRTSKKSLSISCENLEGRWKKLHHTLTIQLDQEDHIYSDPTSPTGEMTESVAFDGALKLNNYTFGPPPENTVWKIEDNWRWHQRILESGDLQTMKIRAIIPRETGYSVELHLHRKKTSEVDSLSKAVFHGSMLVGNVPGDERYATGIDEGALTLVRCEVTRKIEKGGDCI